MGWSDLSTPAASPADCPTSSATIPADSLTSKASNKLAPPLHYHLRRTKRKGYHNPTQHNTNASPHPNVLCYHPLTAKPHYPPSCTTNPAPESQFSYDIFAPSYTSNTNNSQTRPSQDTYKPSFSSSSCNPSIPAESCLVHLSPSAIFGNPSCNVA
jgi:hypothetical protein